jgi:hypothetical protein
MADDQAGRRKQRHACRRGGAEGWELHIGRAQAAMHEPSAKETKESNAGKTMKMDSPSPGRH